MEQQMKQMPDSGTANGIAQDYCLECVKSRITFALSIKGRIKDTT